MFEKLSEMEHKLKLFVLNNKDFFNLAKKYTFMFRDFTPFIDYCKICWNNVEKNWRFIDYHCHNQNKKLLQEKVNVFFLDLNIEGYNWGTLLGELDLRFEKFLEKNLVKEDIDKNSKKFKEIKTAFFNQNKEKIVDNFFKINEETIEEYFSKTLKKFREQRFEQVNRLMH